MTSYLIKILRSFQTRKFRAGNLLETRFSCCSWSNIKDHSLEKIENWANIWICCSASTSKHHAEQLFCTFYLEWKDAAYGECDDHQGQQHGGSVAQIPRGFHQRNASYLPVIAQHSWDQQQPGVEGQQIRICQNPGKQRNGEGGVMRMCRQTII